MSILLDITSSIGLAGGWEPTASLLSPIPEVRLEPAPLDVGANSPSPTPAVLKGLTVLSTAGSVVLPEPHLIAAPVPMAAEGILPTPNKQILIGLGPLGIVGSLLSPSVVIEGHVTYNASVFSASAGIRVPGTEVKTEPSAVSGVGYLQDPIPLVRVEPSTFVPVGYLLEPSVDISGVVTYFASALLAEASVPAPVPEIEKGVSGLSGSAGVQSPIPQVIPGVSAQSAVAAVIAPSVTISGTVVTPNVLSAEAVLVSPSVSTGVIVSSRYVLYGSTDSHLILYGSTDSSLQIKTS